MIFPRRAPQATFQLQSGQLLVRWRDAEYSLTGVAAAVFAAADGTRDLPSLLEMAREQAGAEVTREDVFYALDALADHGLLAERAVPPAAAPLSSRRSVVKLLGAAAALAVTVPSVALGAPSSRNNASLQGEQGQKRGQAAEDRAKAELHGSPNSESNRKYQAEQDEKQAAEQQAKVEAEEQAKRDAEEQEKRDAEVQQKRDAEAAQKRDAEEQQKRDAEVQQKRDAEEQEKRDAEERAKRDQEQQSKGTSEQDAKRDAEAQAKRDAEAQAKAGG